MANSARPLPVHSRNELSEYGAKSRSWSRLRLTGSSAVGAPSSPSPKISSRYDAGSILGVRVWLRTKKRLFAVANRCSCADSQRISAFVS